MSKFEEDHFDDLEQGVEPEEPEYSEDEVLMEDEPYTTDDLIKATVDLLNNDFPDWETGSYVASDEAFDNLDRVEVMKSLTSEEWDDMYQDWDKLGDFMRKHPENAEEIFNAVAKAFGFANYVDYTTYNDWVADDLEEATNSCAINSTPGKHVLLDLDEDGLDYEDEVKFTDPNNY